VATAPPGACALAHNHVPAADAKSPRTPRAPGAGTTSRCQAGCPVLTIFHALLSDPAATYHDLGPDYYQHRLNVRRQAHNHLQSLKRLGYHVTIHDINPDTCELLTAIP
jgi:hypothetical protein